MGLEALWSAFTASLPVLGDAWPTVAWLIALSLVLGWAVGRFMYGQRIEDLRATIDALKGQIALRDDKIAFASTPEEARALIAALEKRLTAIEPRALTEGQMVSITTILLQRPLGAIISRDVSSADSDFIYHQMQDAFRMAHWATHERVIIGLKEPPQCGLTLMTRPDSSEDAIDLIRRALRVAKVEFEERSYPAVEDDVSLPQLNFSSPRA